MYDVVLRGGEVVDGSGNPRYRADVAVKDGLIAAVGHLDEPSRRTIDAEGLVVTPGFVDGHTHLDAQVFWDHSGTSSCWHGVTSVAMGNCGFTLAPARRDARHLVVHNLERAEDIPAPAMAEGIEWRWEHFAEYLDAVESTPKAINYAGYVGHSALRTWAMGERAFEEAATEDDLVAMEAELRSALAAGALGLSTSRSTNHETPDDRPVASRLAGWDEVRRLAAVLGEASPSWFEIALEPETRLHGTPEQRDSFERLEALALDTGVTLTFGVSATDWSDDELEFVDRATKAGAGVVAQTHCRGIWIVSSFKTRLAFDVLPVWRDVRSRPLEEQRHLLADPDVRARLVEAAESGDFGRTVGSGPKRPVYERLNVVVNPAGLNPTVASIARQRGTGPVETIIDLALESGFDQLFMEPAPGFHNMDDDDIEVTLRHPNGVMTFSDSGAHVSQIIDTSIQTYLLAHWVRERQSFSLEEGVRMITDTPARAFGFHGRGLVRAGYAADLNVFDPATIAPLMPTVEHDLPGGAMRLVQRATGFTATLVAGEVTLLEGEDTGERPGRLLRARR